MNNKIIHAFFFICISEYDTLKRYNFQYLISLRFNTSWPYQITKRYQWFHLKVRVKLVLAGTRIQINSLVHAFRPPPSCCYFIPRSLSMMDAKCDTTCVNEADDRKCHLDLFKGASPVQFCFVFSNLLRLGIRRWKLVYMFHKLWWILQLKKCTVWKMWFCRKSDSVWFK